jgi:hypothetical protein
MTSPSPVTPPSSPSSCHSCRLLDPCAAAKSFLKHAPPLPLPPSSLRPVIVSVAQAQRCDGVIGFSFQRKLGGHSVEKGLEGLGDLARGGRALGLGCGIATRWQAPYFACIAARQGNRRRQGTRAVQMCTAPLGGVP